MLHTPQRHRASSMASKSIHLKVLHVIFVAIAFGDCWAQNSRKELRTNEMNQEKVIKIGHTMRGRTIDPSQVIQLSWKPRVFLYRDFLSTEECDYLISRIKVHQRNSITDDSSWNGTRSIPSNFDIPIDANDEVARRIEERLSAWTFLPLENSESLRLLHFGPEDSSSKSYNYFGSRSPEQVGQPFLATVILYLSSVSQGGQILFPRSEKKIWSDCPKNNNALTPTRGNAIVFFNLHLNATPDRSSFHARCPVLQGDMWCATKFFYLKEMNQEKNLPLSDEADCTDEDENCSNWAATGECQKNPLFMIGSPDYYGTCRKSCNACSL